MKKFAIDSHKKNFTAIILAAGEGKRMKSSLSKVLHPIAGKPILAHTVSLLNKVQPRKIIIVANPKNLKEVKQAIGSDYIFAIQKKPQGTADAAKTGLAKVDSKIQTVGVMYGDDTAFYKPETITNAFIKHQKTKSKITFTTLIQKNPTGLGRILRKKGKLTGIVEEKDATKSQKKIKEINDGVYFFDKKWLLENLPKIKPSPVTGEHYLTDLIGIALKNRQAVETYQLEDPNQWQGINTRKELLIANRKSAQKSLSSGQRIHLMGAAGAGASAVSAIASGRGYQVSGCDVNPFSSYTKNHPVKISKGHSPSHLKSIDMLVASPAVLKLDPKNKELQAAKKLNIPISTWQEFQAKFLQKDKFVICVAGGYGKSTTTAMLSKILIDAGLDPTCEIGAKVIQWGTNYKVGKTRYYVCEADEYNNNFLNYRPDIAVILNIAWDHPDFFRSKKSVIASYKLFANKIKKNGKLIIANDQNLNLLTKSVRPDIKIIRFNKYENLDLSIIGEFRKENAAAALATAAVLKMDPKKAKESTESFMGLERRLEYKGEIDNVKVYDDYAVQPYTVKRTADAIKDKFKNQKVVLVFEPHTFSRINTFFNDFVTSLKESKIDRILITQVYPAREKGNPQKLANKLARAIGPKARYTGSLEDTARYLKGNLNAYNVILSMGAGEIYKLYDKLRHV